MKIRTSVLLAALVLTPTFALATPQTKPAPKPAPASAPAVHSTAGTVKSTDATSLVITKKTGTVKEMTFVVNADTQKKGTIATGAMVDVRYKTEGKSNIATAITVQTKK
jgi:hypothetical protein